MSDDITFADIAEVFEKVRIECARESRPRPSDIILSCTAWLVLFFEPVPETVGLFIYPPDQAYSTFRGARIHELHKHQNASDLIVSIKSINPKAEIIVAL